MTGLEDVRSVLSENYHAPPLAAAPLPDTAPCQSKLQRGPSNMAVMSNMMDAADGFPLCPSRSYSFFLGTIKSLHSQYP